MADMVSMIVRETLGADDAHDLLEQLRRNHAGANDLAGMPNASRRPVLFSGLRWHFSEACDPGSIGPVMPITAADVEADDLAVAKLPSGWLDIHERASLAEPDAGDDGEGSILDGLLVESTCEIALAGTFLGDAKCRQDGPFGNARCLAGPFDLGACFDGTDSTDERASGHPCDIRKPGGEQFRVACEKSVFFKADPRMIQARVFQCTHQGSHRIAMCRTVPEFEVTAALCIGDGALSGIDVELAIASDLSDPDVLVRDLVKRRSACNDLGFRYARCRQHHIGLHPGSYPLRQYPETAAICGIFRRRCDHHAKPMAMHLVF